MADTELCGTAAPMANRDRDRGHRRSSLLAALALGDCAVAPIPITWRPPISKEAFMAEGKVHVEIVYCVV